MLFQFHSLLKRMPCILDTLTTHDYSWLCNFHIFTTIRLGLYHTVLLKGPSLLSQNSVVWTKQTSNIGCTVKPIPVSQNIMNQTLCSHCIQSYLVYNPYHIDQSVFISLTRFKTFRESEQDFIHHSQHTA